MPLQTARVVLDITFDNQNDHPANWNWQDLLGMFEGLPDDETTEHFVIVEAS